MKKNNVEEWKPITGFEEKYEVSNFGNIKSKNYRGSGTERILKPKKDTKGYLHIKLSKNNVVTEKMIHRLVAESFIENKYNLPQVNHKDECKTNNHIDNLEWCTACYNVNYGKRTEKARIKVSHVVYQYDLKYNLIKKWESILKTEIEGFNASDVSKCCKKLRKKHKGYRWSLHYPWQ